MAIPFVTIELDRPYQVRFGMGAQLQYEQLSGKTMPELGKELETGLSIKSLCQVLLVLLKKDVQDSTLEKIAELVDNHTDNLDYIIDKVCEVINAAYKTELPNAVAPEAQSLNG